MGLMDRVKAQANSLAQQANAGMTKFEPVNRKTDTLLRSLGVAVLADRTGRGNDGTQAEIDRLTTELTQHESQHNIDIVRQTAEAEQAAADAKARVEQAQLQSQTQGQMQGQMQPGAGYGGPGGAWRPWGSAALRWAAALWGSAAGRTADLWCAAAVRSAAGRAAAIWCAAGRCAAGRGAAIRCAAGRTAAARRGAAVWGVARKLRSRSELRRSRPGCGCRGGFGVVCWSGVRAWRRVRRRVGRSERWVRHAGGAVLPAGR
jgi:hypothetical protein